MPVYRPTSSSHAWRSPVATPRMRSAVVVAASGCLDFTLLVIPHTSTRDLALGSATLFRQTCPDHRGAGDAVTTSRVAGACGKAAAATSEEITNFAGLL